MEEHDYSVLIVDGHPLIRFGLHCLIAQDTRFGVITEAGSAAEGVEKARRQPPSLILLAQELDDMSCLDALHALRAASRRSLIALLVSNPQGDFPALLGCGAQGIILKRSEPATLLAQIVKVAEGGKAYAAALQGVYHTKPHQDDTLSQLTARERQVLSEVARGLGNRQIADSLTISEQTVKVHIRNVLRKLNVHSRVAATVLWLSHSSGRLP